jgi:uncharacterized membrane protein
MVHSPGSGRPEGAKRRRSGTTSGAGKPGLHSVAKAASSAVHGSLGFDRFVFFSDAVFAIAITLLVLDIRLPPGGSFALGPVIPKIIGFGLSFYVIGRYWIAHHQLFLKPQAYDYLLVNLNLAFLASVAFLPFPTSVVIMERPEPAPVGFYTLCLTVVGLLMVALVVMATRPKLRPGMRRGARLRAILNSVLPPLVFAGATGISLVSPRNALFFLAVLIPVGVLGDRLGARLAKRLDGTLEVSEGD